MYVMSDGVSVVAYSDYPTFYSDNYYWMYNGGVWYRSGYYGGGWVVAYDVPYRVRAIDRPHSYARFQPGRGWTRTPTYGGGGVRDHRTYNGGGYSAPATRDHRTSAPTYSPPAPSGPTVRDHRSAPAPERRDVPRGGPTSRPTVRDHRR
jgi:hypothetical protein